MFKYDDIGKRGQAVITLEGTDDSWFPMMKLSQMEIAAMKMACGYVTTNDPYLACEHTCYVKQQDQVKLRLHWVKLLAEHNSHEIDSIC